MAQLKSTLPHVVVGEVQCIFGGTRTRIIKLKCKRAGHPTATRYSIEDFERKNSELEYELGEVERTFSITSQQRGSLSKISCGLYVLYVLFW